MAFLDDLARGHAKRFADLAKGNTRLGRLLLRDGVKRTADFDRVLALPRRSWERAPETVELVELMTQEFKKPRGQQVLHPSQAVIMSDVADYGGAFGAKKVGTGKTHVSFLVASVVEAKRPVLLILGGTKEKTEREFLEISKHWRDPPTIKLVGYEELGLDQNVDLLEELQPDLLIADEGWKLMNIGQGARRGSASAVAIRVERYLQGREDTKFLVMAGTLFEGRPIMKYHHLMRWALVEHMPLPIESSEASLWGRALDFDTPLAQRMELGALSVFGDSRAAAHAGYTNWVCETPGVVVTREVEVAASLEIRIFNPFERHPCAKEITGVWQGRDPAGNELDDIDMPRVAAQLTSGFFYVPTPRPSEEWYDARKQWHRFEQYIRDQRRPGLDSELQVRLACARGEFGNVEAYERWREIEPTCKPVNVAHWVSYDIIDAIVEAAEKGTLIWTLFRAPGEALRDRHGLRFFQEKGRDERGSIEDANGITCVASVSACSVGFNLQKAWHKNFILTPMGSVEGWEQTLGRTHRQFQPADRVLCSVFSGGIYGATIERVRLEAIAMKGSSLPRLALADWV